MNQIGKLTSALALQECKICGRFFSAERIKAHETICEKSSVITKKSFDITQQRIKGTEIEKFAQSVAKGCCLYTEKNRACGLSTNWRNKHEDLVKKVKDAKRLANGKLQKQSSMAFFSIANCEANEEYVQCQYCYRNFNQTSVVRHVETCSIRMCQRKSKTHLRGETATKTSRNRIGNK